MHAEHPDTLVAARQECPLIVGLGEQRELRRLRDPRLPAPRRATCSDSRTARSSPSTPTGRRSPRPTATPVEREIEEVTWDEEAAEKGGYPTFMLKEIHEQPDAVAETIADRLPELDRVDLSELELVGRARPRRAPDRDRRLRHLLPRRPRRPLRDRAVGAGPGRDGHRLRVPLPRPGRRSDDDLVIGITQSGETADTLAAMRLARERGASVLAITNIMGSQATRDADAVLYTRAGLEIGVAATKTFVSQVAAMYLLGLWLAQARGHDAAERIAELIAELKALPHLIQETIVADRRRGCGRSRAATRSSASSSTSAATSAFRSASRAR